MDRNDYDRWLEAPYTRAAEDDAAYERFCERNNLPIDSPHSEAKWQAYKDAWGD